MVIMSLIMMMVIMSLIVVIYSGDNVIDYSDGGYDENDW